MSTDLLVDGDFADGVKLLQIYGSQLYQDHQFYDNWMAFSNFLFFFLPLLKNGKSGVN